MPDPIAPPREAFYVVVAGLMNPAIHHPHWYRVIGAIDEAELQSSLTNGVNSTTPIAAQLQFGVPRFSVSCQPGQWWIQTHDPDSWARMIKIASLVFSRLNETPVSAFGLLSQCHLDTQTSEVKSIIAKSIVDMNFGLRAGKSTASNVQMTVIEEDFEVITSIQPSLISEISIFGSHHCQYQPPKAPSGYFDLGALLGARIEKYLETSKTFFSDIVAAVNTRAKGAE